MPFIVNVGIEVYPLPPSTKVIPLIAPPVLVKSLDWMSIITSWDPPPKSAAGIVIVSPTSIPVDVLKVHL